MPNTHNAIFLTNADGTGREYANNTTVGVGGSSSAYPYVAPIELFDSSKYTKTTINGYYDGTRTESYDISNVDFLQVRYSQLTGVSDAYMKDINGNTIPLGTIGSYIAHSQYGYNLSNTGIVDARGFTELYVYVSGNKFYWYIDEYVKV